MKDADIIRMIKEEWDSKVSKLLESSIGVKSTLDIDNDGNKEIIISPELKVLHTSSKIRYTVDSVSPRDIILRTPEGEQFIVDRETLEKEYEID